VITDSIDSLKRFQESGIQNANFLAFMDVTDKKTIEIFEEFNNNLVDLSEYVAEANQMVRNFYTYEYIEFIRVFLLQLDSKESSEVAFLDFTERSPFKGTLANQLFILSLTHLAMLNYDSKTISVELKDPNLNRVILSEFESSVSSKKIYLMYLIQVLRFFLSNYILPKFLGLLKKSKTKLTNCFFTIYPYWWLRSSTSNPEERFFPNIEDKRNESKSGYLTWLEDSFQNLWTKRHQIREFGKKDNVEFLNAYLKISDFIPLISIQKMHEFERFLNWDFDESTLRIGTFNVAELVRQDIARSLSEGEYVRSKLINSAIKRYVGRNQPASVVFRFENQPIDRAIINGVGQVTKSVGYWHTALSLCENYLSLWNIQDLEETFSGKDIVNSVWPNHMLYPNIICRGSILREGYPSDLMYPIELTRHQRVLDLYLSRKTSTIGPVKDLKQDDRIVVVSLTADESNSLLMLSATITACGNLKNLKISVKPHPAWSFDLETFKATHPDLEVNRIEVVNINDDIFRILQSADLLVTSGTQMVFEGMLLGVMPIIYEPKYSFNPTNFENFSDICFVTYSSIELKELIHSVLDNGVKCLAKKKLWPNFLNAFFGLDDDRSQKSLHSALIKINSSN
jgi:hypothetical protein